MSGNSYLINAMEYLINLTFGFYLLAVMLRFLLQLVQADFHNPISQFLRTITDPVLRYLRYFIGDYFGIDWSSVLLLVSLQAAEICLLSLLTTGHMPTPILALAALIVAILLTLLIYIYIFVIILQVLISLVQTSYHTPFTLLLSQLSAPLFRRIRRYVPVSAGIDWSPMLLLVCLNLLLILLVAPLHDWGQQQLSIQQTLLTSQNQIIQ